jgi:hypothetical protein
MKASRIYPGTWRINFKWTVEKLLWNLVGILVCIGVALGLLAYDLSKMNQSLRMELEISKAQVVSAMKQADFWHSASREVIGSREELEKILAELNRINRQMRIDIDTIESHRGGIKDGD